MAMDVYQIVTDQIIELLEGGTIPWQQPWARGTAGFPRNLRTGKSYRGINVFLLAVTAWQQGYESAYWLTFKQARERGGTVKKGEQSTLVVFWKQLEIEDEESGKKKRVPCLRYYRVFNVAQCDGIEAPDVADEKPLDFLPIEAAAQIVDGYATCPTITYGGTRACYRPLSDEVLMPNPERFVSAEAFYNVLFHELVHSTGHGSRLARFEDAPTAFGSADYSKEELIAEMGAAFLSAHAGIVTATVVNSAAYIQGWLKQLRNDKRLVVGGAGAAQKAVDWILGRRVDAEES
jgi:antirestriction protein ArdC